MRKALFVTTLGIGIAALLAEAGLRLAGHAPPSFDVVQRPRNHPARDPHMGWRLPPETHTEGADGVCYRADGQGFRTDGTHPRPLHFRVLFLGDSFTFGVGVDEPRTFVAEVERRLHRVHCTNLAVQGFGVDQMWLALQHYGFSRHPHLVVLCFIDDDLDRSLTNHFGASANGNAKPLYRLVDDELVLAPPSWRPGTLAERLDARSALWHAARTRFESLTATSYRWRLNRHILRAASAACAQRGISFAVVRLPERDVTRRFEPLTELADEMLVLDLAERRPDPEGLYFPDGHPNERGHAWIAEEVAGALTAWGVVP